MNISKRLFLPAVMALGTFGWASATTAADELSDDLKNFIKGANLMMEGINNKDEKALTQAADFFGCIDCNPLENFQLTERNSGDLTKPVVQFNDQYCDKVRANKFNIIEMDPVEMTRSLFPNVYIHHSGVNGGGELTYSLDDDAEGSTTFCVAASHPSALQCEVRCGDSKMTLQPDEKGYVSLATMDIDSSPIYITITNPTENPISYTIAIN